MSRWMRLIITENKLVDPTSDDPSHDTYCKVSFSLGAHAKPVHLTPLNRNARPFIPTNKLNGAILCSELRH